MNEKLSIFVFFITLIIASFLLLGVRKSMIRGGAVILWLGVFLALATLPFLEQPYKWLSDAMGFKFATDMLTMFSILFLLVYGFYLTAKLIRVNDYSDILLARLAILEAKCDAIDVSLKRIGTK